MTALRSVRTEDLFARWFLLVYLPLGLLVVGFIFFILQLLPGWAIPALIALAIWGIFAVRLILERRKRGLEIPPPRSLVLGALTIAGLALGGVLLVLVGLARVSSAVGITLLLLGGFLMLLAVFAPAFKLVDIVLRAIRRLFRIGRRRASESS